MEFSNRVAEVTQQKFAPKILDKVLGEPNPVLKELIKNMPEVEYTLKDKMYWKLQPIRRYFSLLFDALLNRHTCDYSCDEEW